VVDTGSRPAKCRIVGNIAIFFSPENKHVALANKSCSMENEQQQRWYHWTASIAVYSRESGCLHACVNTM